jgi:acyl-CoA dehydrogenase
MIKVQAPNMALQIIDDAIQAHGGAGVSEDFGLAHAYAGISARCGSPTVPDEVHNRAIARIEFGKHSEASEPRLFIGRHRRFALNQIPERPPSSTTRAAI